MTAITIEKQLQDLPTHFPVMVLMQSQPGTANRWSGVQWQVVGIMAGQRSDAHSEQMQLAHEDGDMRTYLHSGFEVRLHVDECESYYYNLISPAPCCYVIAQQDDAGMPVPFLVTMSSDEANAHLECEDEVFVVDVPPELYRWTEAFVLMHYSAEKRLKRKRDNWKDQAKPGVST